MNVNEKLKQYIETKILPCYDDKNLGGHGIEHIRNVISRSFELAEKFNLELDFNMVYTVASYHDIGYKINHSEHALESAKILLNDASLTNFFNKKQIQTMVKAIEDHSSNLSYEARNIYGKLVSSADREISVNNILKRSFLFQSFKHQNDNLSIMQLIEKSYQKLLVKYGKNGYAKMYFPDDKYIRFLEQLQKILESKEKFIEKQLYIVSHK